MNTEEKEKQQKIIVLVIQGVENAIKKAVEMKDQFRTKMNDMAMNGTATAMYTQEYIDGEIQKVKNDFAAKMQTANTDMVSRLDSIQNLVHDRDAVLDLTNVNFSTGLSLIQTLGSALTYDQALLINANFIHDQQSLRALRSAYEARALRNHGDINSMIYDLDSNISKLKELAYAALIQESSLNYFADAFSKFAKLEGVTTENLPDKVGFDLVARAAAGL